MKIGVNTILASALLSGFLFLGAAPDASAKHNGWDNRPHCKPGNSMSQGRASDPRFWSMGPHFDGRNGRGWGNQGGWNNNNNYWGNSWGNNNWRDRRDFDQAAFDQRQARLRDLIAQRAASGRLSPQEQEQLLRRAGRIDDLESRFFNTGNSISPYEGNRLTDSLSRLRQQLQRDSWDRQFR